MDENPWGAPTPSPRADPTPPEFPSLPSIEPLDTTTKSEEEIIETTTEGVKVPIEVEEELVLTGLEDDDLVGEFTERIEEPTIPRRLSVAAELPPMDEFPVTPSEETTSFDVSSPIVETLEVEDLVDDDGFDDFADFGESGEGGDDFGSFGGDNEDEFSLPPLSSFSAIEESIEPEIPIASTSTARCPTLDLSNPTIDGLKPQLLPFLEKVYPSSSSSLTDEHERQVDGVAQVLVTEGLRSLLVNLSSLPPLKPLDWRRSRIRREHLITLGVPINLDDSPDAKTLASLVLPSQIKRTTTPAPTSAASPSQSTSNSASNRTITASPIPSRSSTPTISSSTAYRNPINPAPAPPPLDTSRANEICNYQELDLSLLSLEQLRALKEEMEGFRMSVSIRLEFELGVREKEVGDGEAYHVMIQDLVTAASRMKTTRGAAVNRSNSGTSKWGRKISK